MSYSNAISHFVFISDDESLREQTEIYEPDFAKQRHVFQKEESARDMIFIKQIFTPFVWFDIAKGGKTLHLQRDKTTEDEPVLLWQSAVW